MIAGLVVNVEVLLGTEFAVTTTELAPAGTPAGTGTTMLVSAQVVGVAVIVPNLTVLAPWVDPNVVPLIVTTVPTTPDVGERLVIFGVTVKVMPLVSIPEACTTTGPVVAPAGTGTTILPAAHEVGVAVMPLNFTVLVPCVAPKFAPVIVTEAATGPEVTDSEVMLGVPETVKLTPLLALLFAVTTTFPVTAPLGTGATMEVSLHEVGIAVTVPNFNVLAP